MTDTLMAFGERWMTGLAEPEFWWQVLLLVTAFGISALFNRRLQAVLESSNITSTGFRHIAIRSAQRLLWPLSMLVLVIPARAVLDHYFLPSQLLHVAVPVLLALAVVRFSIYVLRKAFTANPLLKSSENVLALAIWVIVILHLMGWLPVVLGMLDGMAFQMGEARVSLLDAINLLVLVGVAFTLAIWLAEMINRQISKTEYISPAMRVGINKFSKFLLISLAFLLALNAVGINLTSLAIFGGALGVGLGFGLQRIASNYISGFILVLDRSIKPGDVITIGDKFGWVDKLNARYVVVRNREGVDTLIPNENLITSEVINWSYSDRNVRLRVPVQISYDDDPEEALKLMLECAHASPRVIDDPEPSARLIAFGDNGIELQLRVWVADPEAEFGNVRSEINLAIWRAFKQAGITIPYPQRDVHIKEHRTEPEED